MRNVNVNVLSAADNQSTNGSQIDANQLISASFHAYFGDSNAAGTVKLQASNDICPYGNVAANFSATNWVDVPSQTTNIASGASALLTVANMAYRWIRPVYTSTATGAQTIVPIADTGVKQVQTVTSVADTGALERIVVTCPTTAGATQADYFVLFSPSGTSSAFWLDIDGAGTAPTGAAYVAATNKIKVSIVAAGSAADTGAAVILAAASTIGYAGVDNMDGTVTFTQSLLGVCTAPARHNADDSGNGSFSLSVSTAGAASNLNSKYFTLSSINTTSKAQKNFYLWLNINSQGVDPAVAGKTAIPVAAAAGASANTVATAMRAALNALTGDFAATGSNAAVIITSVAPGPVTAAADGAAATGFTFGSATSGVASNLNNKYFLLSDASNANLYYVWLNVSSIGTDPSVAGRTGAAVAFAAGASAGTIGTAIASVIAALNSTNSFTTSGTTTVTVTNKVAGPFTPMSDGTAATGFTFAVTGGGSTTINVNMNALSI